MTYACARIAVERVHRRQVHQVYAGTRHEALPHYQRHLQHNGIAKSLNRRPVEHVLLIALAHHSGRYFPSCVGLHTRLPPACSVMSHLLRASTGTGITQLECQCGSKTCRPKFDARTTIVRGLILIPTAPAPFLFSSTTYSTAPTYGGDADS